MSALNDKEDLEIRELGKSEDIYFRSSYPLY